jgi:hypothetical protein
MWTAARSAPQNFTAGPSPATGGSRCPTIRTPTR